MRLLLLMLASIFVANCYAGGFQVPAQSQKQMGMANTGTALPQDASIMFQNPGGLSFVKYSQISLSGWLFAPKFQFLEEGTNQLYTTEKKLNPPFSFYGSFSPKPTDKWKVGLAVYVPYAAIIQWPSDWAGRYVITKVNLATINVQPTFSYKIADKVGIGASVVYSLGTVDLQRALPLQDTLGNTASAQLKGMASGVGFNVGVHYQITPKIAIGASYKHKITYKPKSGSATFNVPESLRDSVPNTTLSTTLTTPWEVDFGISYKPTPKVTLAFDAKYIGWKVFDAIDIHFAQTTSVLTDLNLPRNFKNVPSFHLGGQYQIDSIIAIRAGTFYDITPVTDGYVPPEVPDNNRYGITLGATATFGHLDIDFSFMYFETVARQESQAANYANLGGTYKGRALGFGLGIEYSFYKSKKKGSEEEKQ